MLIVLQHSAIAILSRELHVRNSLKLIRYVKCIIIHMLNYLKYEKYRMKDCVRGQLRLAFEISALGSEQQCWNEEKKYGTRSCLVIANNEKPTSSGISGASRLFPLLTHRPYCD